MYDVDKDIPIPESITNAPAHNAKKYPFTTMRVGDSFLVKTEKDRGRALSAGNMHSCTKAGQGHRYRSKKVHGGFRIWRIA